MHDRETIFPLAARTTTTNSADFDSFGNRGARFYVNVTATSGTPTLDLKIQGKDILGGVYHDLAGAAFAQIAGTATDQLVVYPGVAETANESVSDVLPRVFRVVATIAGGTPSLTFSVTAEFIP